MVLPNKMIFGAVIGGLLVAAPACQEMQHIVQQGEEYVFGGSQTQEESANKSLVALGISAAVLKATDSDNAEAWAIAIAAGTYVADRVITNEVEKRRAEYDRESEYLDSEIATAEKSLDERKGTLAKIEEDIAKQEKKVVELENLAKQNKLDKAAAEKTSKEIEQLISNTKAELEVAEAEISIYTEAVKTSMTKTDDSVTEQQLQERRDELTEKRDQRLAQHKLLLDSVKRAEKLKERVDAVK